MNEHWVDPRDAEFFAELKRLTKEAREGQISVDTSQRGSSPSSRKQKKTSRVLIRSSIVGLGLATLAFVLFKKKRKDKEES